MKTLLILFQLLFTCFLIAQSKLPDQQAGNTLTGKVADAKGAGIFAANVYLKSNPSNGEVTDFDGYFSIDFNSVRDTLVVSFIGFESLITPIHNIDLTAPLQLSLNEVSKDFAEVVITAKAPISEQYAVTKLEKMDIYFNPASQGDALKAITTLPSSTTDDESANPSLRGSSEDRSRVVLNGVPIYRPVRNSQLNGLGNFSIFNTELIDQQYVYASNPPLIYGNTSAGLVEIQTIKKLEQNQLQVSANLASAGVLLSQNIGKKAFVQAFSNHQLSNAFIGLNQKSLTRLNDFGSTDVGLNFHYQLSDKTEFNSFTYAIDEGYDFTLNLFSYEASALSGKQRIFSVNNLKHYFEKGVLGYHFGTNHSKTNFEFGNLQSVNQVRRFYNAIDYQYFANENIKLQTGISHDFTQQQFDNVYPLYFYAFAPEAPSEMERVDERNHNAEVYLYSTWKVGEEWSFSSGIRSNLPISNQKHYLSAQLGIRYQLLPNHSLLLSGGQYHSYTTPNFNIQEFRLLGATQVALDYAFEKDNTKINAAVYFKNETGDQALSEILITSRTRIFGIELFWQQQLGKYFQFSLANSFLDHQIEVDGAKSPGRYDLNYFAKASVQFMPPKLPAIALNYIGRPGHFYTPITAATFNEQANFFAPTFSESVNSKQFDNYNRLDLSLSRYFPMGKHSLVAFLNIANIFNIKNEMDVFYNRDYSLEQFDYYTQRTIYFGVVWSKKK